MTLDLTWDMTLDLTLDLALRLAPAGPQTGLQESLILDIPVLRQFSLHQMI